MHCNSTHAKNDTKLCKTCEIFDSHEYCMCQYICISNSNARICKSVSGFSSYFNVFVCSRKSTGSRHLQINAVFSCRLILIVSTTLAGTLTILTWIFSCFPLGAYISLHLSSFRSKKTGLSGIIITCITHPFNINTYIILKMYTFRFQDYFL